MTSALEALKALAVFAKRPRPLQDGAVETRRAVERLKAPQDDKPRPPPEDELEQLYQRLRHLFEAGRGGEATRRDIARAPWILWTDRGEPRAASIPGLVEAVLEQAGARRRTLRSLAHCWVLTLDPESRSHGQVGQELDRLVRASDDPRLVWAKRAAQDLDLSDPARASNRLANRLLTGSEPVASVLAHYGFANPQRAVSGFLRATLAAALKAWTQLAGWRNADSILERLLAFACLDGKLRFPHQRGRLATLLLAPWFAASPPAEKVRAQVQRFLLDHLGDPRVRPQAWIGVEPEALQLFKSWLARASLQAFFAIIREHALDRQWRYRERFWKACLEKGAIADVWLALGYEVASEARLINDLRGAYGILFGSSDPKHAVMLMRIRPLVLCEWSHNGKLRAWPADWPQAPKLGSDRYEARTLKTTSLVFPNAGQQDGLRHAGSETGRWQERAAKMLRERCGLDLRPEDYMP